MNNPVIPTDKELLTHSFKETYARTMEIHKFLSDNDREIISKSLSIIYSVVDRVEKDFTGVD